MLRSNDTYIESARKMSRNSYIEILFGLYNKEANNNLSSIIGTWPSFSEPKITDDTENINQYVSCEPGRTFPNNNVYFINSNDSEKNTNQNIGYWSNVMSDSNGTFTTAPYITYKFDKAIEFNNITLYFQEVCSEILVNFYLDSNLVESSSISNNTNLRVETNLTSTFTANEIKITFIQTAEPYRYVKYNNIMFGAFETFEKDEILNIDINNEVDLYSDELTSNTLNFDIRNNGEYDLYDEGSKLQFLQEKQEINVYHYLEVDGNYIRKKLGTYLLKEYESDDMSVSFSCYDDIYFMNKIYYGSKFYENANITEIFNDLFSYFNYSKFDISDLEEANIRLTGYIQPVSMREALRLIAEAGQCCVFKTKEGITKIIRYSNLPNNSVIDLSQNEVFYDKPRKNLYNNVIDVVENVYNVKVNKNIYDGKLNKGIYTISFTSYPAINLTSNAIILETYACGAKIEVLTDNSNIIVSGDVYEENKINHRINLNPTIAVDEYAIQSVDNNLITSQYYDIANWKLNKSPIIKNLQIMNMPFLELGDNITYVNRIGNVTNLRIDNIEITNSIKSYLKGD